MASTRIIGRRPIAHL